MASYRQPRHEYDWLHSSDPPFRMCTGDEARMATIGRCGDACTMYLIQFLIGDLVRQTIAEPSVPSRSAPTHYDPCLCKG